MKEASIWIVRLPDQAGLLTSAFILHKSTSFHFILTITTLDFPSLTADPEKPFQVSGSLQALGCKSIPLNWDTRRL